MGRTAAPGSPAPGSPAPGSTAPGSPAPGPAGRWARAVPVLAALALVMAAMAGSAPAHAAPAAPAAPVQTGEGQAGEGPAFTTTPEARAAALACPSSLAGATVDPVLLVHGTALEADTTYDWNWQPALDADGIPWCTVQLVERGMGDAQDSAEHLVHAIRTMAAESGRRVDIVGHSQGGMVPRWALRWWPDTRDLVDDLVGLAPSNHGSQSADGACAVSCAPAIQQQRSDSAFIGALNAEFETVAGIDYTVIYTTYDGVVTPNADAETGSSSLRTGDGARANIAVQDLCPAAVTDHLSIATSDAPAYALARDALDNDGPAQLDRVDPAVCNELAMPGVDPLTAVTDYAAVGTYIAESLVVSAQVTEEPPLRCYVTDSCNAAATQPTDTTTSTVAPSSTTSTTVLSAARTLPTTGGTSAPRVAVFVGVVALAGILLAAARRFR